MLHHVVRLAAAAFTVAAAGVVLPSPAQASTCSTGSGVSVVVDFHQLGGGVQTFCDAGGAGENAATQFEDAGHTLTYVQGEPFVCEVDGAPATQCVRTPPANAYWSLWWSDGKSGTWKYSSTGVTSLEVPDGGSVALSWQGQSSQAKPRATPPGKSADSPSTSPSTHPSSSPHPSTRPSQAPQSSAPPRSTDAPSDAASSPPGKAGEKKQHHRSQAGQGPGKGSPGTDSTQSGEALGPVTSSGSDDSGGSGSGGLPGWVAPVAVVVLFGGAGTIALLRRKSRGGT